ncbi:receptor-type tyrosine-protein phosphatase alpha-like isoform X2 [Dysidea avara]|uniref:receptor-type tyrosine-protein phosphatase alpha-like isoform X2 n=2 Tax=Dysidea avara TaxID=196820 RepID=UPI00333217F7
MSRSDCVYSSQSLCFVCVHVRAYTDVFTTPQTQYTFIHNALEELITCGETAFNVQDMVTRVNRLNSVVAGKGMTGFKEQFDLSQQVSRKWTEGDCSDALSQHNVSKNRDNSCVPYNISGVQMKATPLPGSDYINASFVDGYKQRNAFIATQCPMENTTNDFWRVMWELQSAIIVLLFSPEHDKENFYQFWPDEETDYGKVKVSLKSKNERNSYNGYKFSIIGEAVSLYK